MTNSKHTQSRTRTGRVITITAVTMVAEVVAGIMTGSMALLADGWHMATHVGALSITWAGYYLADHPRFRQRFAFGGGKILVLGAYTSAIILLLTSLWMVVESVTRLIYPETIMPKEAMIVTTIGLVVNLISMWILGGHDHGHSHAHGHAHDHAPTFKKVEKHQHAHGADCSHDHDHGPKHEHKDLNMESAYAHVLADALTSVLAILALAGAWFFNWTWLDPAVGIIGAGLIFKWGIALVKQSSHELLDAHAARVPPIEVEEFLKNMGLKSSCLHVWHIEGEKIALVVRVAPGEKALPPLTQLRETLQKKFHLDHLVIEMSPTEVPCSLDGHPIGGHEH